ncbi:MAG: hypothetical protein LUC22_03910, partial [Prevotella sp.]|nr:hypothetical protein [Prevotella sp.]
PSALEIAAQRHANRTAQDIQDITDRAAERERYLALVPDELKIGKDYLGDASYRFSTRFFALVDPKKPIKLEIADNYSRSYSTGKGNLVHIGDKGRRGASKWERIALIYHEYGHCIDAQRTLWRDKDLISMRNKQIARLRKHTDKKVYMQWDYDYKTHRNTYRKMSVRSEAEYIDERLKALREKISSMDEVTFTKRGITKADVQEQILSTRDTLKSLITKYGEGHSSAYYSQVRMKETEYLAHAFENTFVGNKVFQKVMPDIYNEMIGYIKSLQ